MNKEANILKTWDVRSTIAPTEMIGFMRDFEAIESCPMHAHEFIELEYICSGKGTQIINNVKYNVSKGSVLFLKIGDIHSYHPIGRMSVINCVFLPRFLEDIDFLDCEHLPTITNLSGADIFEFERLLFFMEEELQKRRFGYAQMIKSCLSIILTMIFRYTQQQKGWSKKISAILEYIHANYREIKPSDVAMFFSYNQSYISKKFKDELGMTITSYINRLRIEDAVQLLCDTDLSAEQISEKIGYKNKKMFYKAFRDITGTTPYVFQRKGNLSALAFENSSLASATETKRNQAN